MGDVKRRVTGLEKRQAGGGDNRCFVVWPGDDDDHVIVGGETMTQAELDRRAGPDAVHVALTWGE